MNAWNSLIASLPQPHFLQTTEWGSFKRYSGWHPHYLIWEALPDGRCALREISPETLRQKTSMPAAAMVLRREIAVPGIGGRLGVLYAPKGPLLDWSNEDLACRVIADLEGFARRQGAIFLKIDPDVPCSTGPGGEGGEQEDHLGPRLVESLKERGWLFSGEQVQFRNTVMLDLSPTEDELLARMKQKTRYNIRLAAKKGVRIRTGKDADIDLLYRMYAETSVRDGFVIRDAGYYRQMWGAFMEAGLAEPLIAEVEGEAVAAIVVFHFAGRAWYLNGMSREAHREKMPNYLLQWEAIRRLKDLSCIQYDLWGAPDVFDESDPMWGVYRFKEGLGGQVVRHIGAWDLPVRPLLYRLYTQALPRLLDILRSRGKAATRRELSQ
jgi:lipid II:glycine glycyltransferase (peptidoglycan interpeptide bridge formation enzyme)